MSNGRNFLSETPETRPAWSLRRRDILLPLFLITATILGLSADAFAAPRKESWRLKFIEEELAGYTCTLVYPATEGKVRAWRVIQKDFLKYELQNRPHWEFTQYSVLEKENGDFLSSDYQRRDNLGRTRSQSVTFAGDRLKIDSMLDGRPFETDILYPADLKSSLFLETLSLRVAAGRSFQPKDRLKWRFFSHEANAIDYRQATLLNPRQIQSDYFAPVMLAKASFRSNLPTVDLRTYDYFDQTGTVRKREVWTGNLHWEEFAVTPEQAYTELGGPDLDRLFGMVSVKPIDMVNKLTVINFNIGSRKQDMAEFFVDGDFQLRRRYSGVLLRDEEAETATETMAGQLPLIRPGGTVPPRVADRKSASERAEQKKNITESGIQQIGGTSIRYEMETIHYRPGNDETPADNSFRLTVGRAVIPREAVISAAPAIYLADAPLLQMRHPLVQQLAERGVNSVVSPAEKVERLVKLVHLTLKQKREMTTKLRPASEIVTSEQGSPADHAVLLTALLRLHQIPARPAAGLTWHSGFSCFLPSVWTEVRLEDKWYPVDAVTGQIELSPLYLKMADTSLAANEAPARMFAPLIQSHEHLVISVHSSDPPQKKQGVFDKIPSLLP
ncbi:MAG: hypothetical protein CMJ46_05015 [Planctomyces sp.]|nr:hypothetical protein [Planctomyces sp.]